MFLTLEQKDIVNHSIREKILVTAGPGTGKTHTLIARLAHLINNNDVAPGNEILILSFSRAAVREIRDRCAEVGGNLNYVNVVTFDSYATRLLSLIEPDGIWVSTGYDERIKFAVEAIRDGRAEEFLSGIKHILVDEIQDLVGIRANLVKMILKKTNSGFGLFGDPAQGIYNFQLEVPQERDLGSSSLYKWVKEIFSSDLTEKYLSENHRAASEIAKTTLWAGQKLNEKCPAFENIYDRLLSDLSGLIIYGNKDNFAEKLKRTGNKTAVLCRTNGQALMLSRELNKSKVEHHLVRGAEDRMIPEWIARVLSLSTYAALSKNSFTEYCLSEKIEDSEIEEKWRLLKRAEGEPGNSLNLFKLNSKCRQSNIPDWMNENTNSLISVSSIHRAKGLEFDTVIVAECDYSDNEYIGEECRTLYVALTRPKYNLYKLETPMFKGLILNEKYNRWCRCWGWKTNDIEVKFRDLDKIEPPEPVTARGNTPSEIQKHITENVRRGDSVELVLAGGNNSRHDAVYHLHHNDFVMGKTVPNFAGELLSIIRRKYRKGTLPKKISSLQVEGVETVFGDPGIAEEKGLKSPAGVWLSVRVGGVGFLNYRGDN